jgi:valyl-tRNA synthetase
LSRGLLTGRASVRLTAAGNKITGMLEKTYNATEIEPRIRDLWEAAGAFQAGAGANRGAGADPYCIVIPPPNVTGSLHMGHALNNTLQDVLIRFARMRGRDVLWQPGMDHAGIATQMVVERQMMEAGEPDRRTIGREAFVEKVWRWKGESGGTIVNQLKRLGASCDWLRQRFTMDEGLSAAVVKVFVQLYREGLIYKDKRLVNWDPKLLTAISDLEVQQVETNGHLWHFRYPIEGSQDRFITVATTRPETMLGDTAVAVHPGDERYTDLAGRHVVLPLVGRLIPIVADDYADPEAGSGAVKITPAHDFNDFEVGRRHDLALVNVMDGQARIVLKDNREFADGVAASAELAGTIGALDGLDRFAARERVVAMMDERGLLEKVEDHLHTVPHGDRSNVPVEPFLTDQWYVDAKTLAEPAIASVREGRTVFVPKSWEKTYFDWMENIQPWCISRQLWWGHRIPAWYGPDGEIFVAASEEEAEASAYRHYGSRVKLSRDEDVLDTWFSSALWPFSTLGWPDETAELARYYPTSVLVTGFDIIFFWVARMMMFGLHFMDKEPFPEIYIHGIVRDEQGAKMSKSKGNVVDPLELIDEFGADALRFTMASLATPGRDVKPARSRIEGSRNFGTKLWNAARFCEMNECRPAAGYDPESAELTVNRWILTEAAQATKKITVGIESYRFDEAAAAAYHFVWDTFCDWYLELIKPVLNGGDEAARAETRACAGHVLAGILKVLHPFMPYMSEALWEALCGPREGVLALARWPQADFADAGAAGEINWLVELIGGIRSVRAEMNVPAGARTNLVIVGAGERTRSRLDANAAAIGVLARVDDITLEADVPPGSAQILIGEAIAALPLAGVIDFGAEQARLEKEIARIEGEIYRLDKKLGNEKFIAKAPQAVVQGERDKRGDYAGDREKLQAALKRLRDAA